MNLYSLIHRYSVNFEFIPKADGEYIGGEYIEKQGTPIPMRGAIVAIPSKKIYQSGGYLTAKDLRLFTDSPIAEGKVNYKGSTYNVEEHSDYSEFAGVHSYILKWVNSFEHAKTNSN